MQNTNSSNKTNNLNNFKCVSNWHHNYIVTFFLRDFKYNKLILISICDIVQLNNYDILIKLFFLMEKLGKKMYYKNIWTDVVRRGWSL